MISGYGQHHTNEPGGPEKRLYPYLNVTYSQVLLLAQNPPCAPKKNGQWLIPSSYPSRCFKLQKEHGLFEACWLDFDDTPPPLIELSWMLGYYPGKFLLYNTASATKYNQKARLILPLDEAIGYDKWLEKQVLLNDYYFGKGVRVDRSTERPGQLCYMPNRGEFYNFISKN
jgi:hypothetical protein